MYSSQLDVVSCAFPTMQSAYIVWSKKQTNMSNFHQLEVVGRGSETQFQAGENLNYFI